MGFPKNEKLNYFSIELLEQLGYTHPSQQQIDAAEERLRQTAAATNLKLEESLALEDIDKLFSSVYEEYYAGS